MIKSLRARFEKDEEGFTLIELMVVVLIIAILLAIAIPTFLGARERAQNRAAQSDIRNALTALKTFYTDEEQYTDNADGLLTEIEPSLVYVEGDSTSPDNVGIVVSDTAGDLQGVCVSAQSDSGDDFSLLDIATDADGGAAGTYYFEDLDCGGFDAADTPPATVSRNGW